MFNERLIDTLKELNFWLKRISDGDYSGGGSDGSGSSDDSGSGGGATVGGLVINGTIVESDDGNSFNFIPNAGEPSFDDAVAAFRSGRPVFARNIMSFDGAAVEESIVLFDSCSLDSTDDSSCTISHLYVNNSYLFWGKNDSGSTVDNGEPTAQ